MIYRLPEHINKDEFYNKILSDLTREYYSLKKGDQTQISLVQTRQIDSNVLPLLAGMLNQLANKSKNPVYVELAYNPALLNFLDTIDFFRTLEDGNIIRYDKDYVGGFSKDKYSKDNKIIKYHPIEYFEDKPIEEKQAIRDELAEKIRCDLYCTPMFKKETSPIDNDELFEVALKAITELVVNAIIYSGSNSYTYSQARIAFSKSRRGYIISIIDVGKGFYKSLSHKIEVTKEYTKKERQEFYKYAQLVGIDIEKEISFLAIMEALYYSEKMLQVREVNLYKLKRLLAQANSNFRIHQGNREVIFTSAKCKKCSSSDILHCLECVWNRRKIYADQTKSPVKAYPVMMAGVHIEVEFIVGEKNV